MDLIGLLRDASTSTEAVVAQMADGDRERPSPCPDLTVAQLVAHLIGGIRSFTVVGEGGELSFDPDLDDDPVGESPAGAFRTAVDRLLTVFADRGRLEASYAMPWGPTTGAQLVGFELIETVVHGWDLAQGLGIEFGVDADVARATLDCARLWVDDSVRVPGMFGPEVRTDGGTPIDELVAFLGRDPAWSGHDVTGHPIDDDRQRP